MALEGRAGRKVTPLARRMAQALGVALEAVVGTGPGGRVGAADVRALAVPQQSSSSPVRSVAVAEGRLPVATATVEFDAGALAASPAGRLPVATATVEFDAGGVLAAAAAAQEPRGRARLAVGVAAVVAAAVAGLLPAHPELNGAYYDGAALLWRRVHLAVGEASPGGLRWAVVPDAGDLTARGVARALAGPAAPGGAVTFAVVCLAEGASWQWAEPPLPGTAAALSVGAPGRRAVVIGEAVVVRPVATLTLSYDARLIDHRRAAGFLTALRDRLEQVAAVG